VEGTENIVTGFSSGLTGLFTKPVDEASRGGVVGFVKGVGLGLLGAAVKPVLGIGDGMSSVAQGISNQIVQNNDLAGNAGIAVQIRDPRAFKRWDCDLDVKVLVPLDLEAGRNQKFVLDRRTMNGGYEDSFVDYVSLGVMTVPVYTAEGVRSETQYSAGAVIISDKFLYWRRREAKKLWGRKWSNISHVAVLHADAKTAASFNTHTNIEMPCIRVFLYNSEGHVDIVSGNVDAIRTAYASVEKQAFRMGFPDRVMPPSYSTSFISMASRVSFGTNPDEQSQHQSQSQTQSQSQSPVSSGSIALSFECTSTPQAAVAAVVAIVVAIVQSACTVGTIFSADAAVDTLDAMDSVTPMEPFSLSLLLLLLLLIGALLPLFFSE